MRVDRLGDPLGFVGRRSLGLACVDETEAACPGAPVAEDHERRRSVGPALRQVGTPGVLAHRDESQRADRSPQVENGRRVVDLRTQPVGLAGADRQPVDDSDFGESRRQAHGLAVAIGAHGIARAGAAREQGQILGAVAPRHVLALHPPGSPAFAGDASQHVDDLAHLDVDTLLAERRDRPVADAARHDVLAQVGHVGGDVEGEAVHRPPALETHADGADLARVGSGGVDPHPGIFGETAGADAERGEGVDDHLLDVADVAGGIELVGDGEDRIADELARTVIGDVATAAHRDQLGADVGGLAPQVVGEVRPRSVGEHVRVLEEQQVLFGAAAEERLLHRQGLAVGHAPQPPNPQRSRHSSVDQSLVSRISLTRTRKPAA